MNHTDFELIELGHPHLRRHAEVVKDVSGTDTQHLLDELLAFVLAKNGVGIAAPQVDINQRIFIMCSRPNSRYPLAPDMPPTFIINPEIIWRSDETEKGWEGCLSLPGIRGLVPRHQAIKVRYTTRSNESIEVEYTGFVARIFQHELDHLDGIVYLDRVESTHEIMMEKEWLKLFTSN
ncbi:MAG TPA: peptide deformylase [Methylophaga sp.]|nr:peptide deformylase [Methylophaga sp.]HEC59857.1 peptide deformylase [Methylophaga sp.]